MMYNILEQTTEKQGEIMSINTDHQMREQMSHDNAVFPITFFHDELASLPNYEGPLHWHPEFEITTAQSATLYFQIGQEHIALNKGDSIFINGNILHFIKQLSDGEPDPMPNIVFSGAIIAPETSSIYKKYVSSISSCDSLPYILFRQGDDWQGEVNMLINEIYHQFCEQGECYELIIQRKLNEIFEHIYSNFDALPKSEMERIQIITGIRIQKMLSYIYEHYAENVTLEDIAGAANISRSEAERCFKSYMNCSPVDALIRYRLQVAHRLLDETTLSLKEISCTCGFNSVNYFSRRFRAHYGYAPSYKQSLGK